MNFNNNNNSATLISTNSSAGTGTGLISGPANSYYFALYYSATATTVNGSAGAVVPGLLGFGGYSGWNAQSFVLSDPNWQFVATAGSLSTPGRFATVNPVALPGGGSSGQLVVIGWSANIGWSVAELANFINGDSYPASGDPLFGESAVSGTINFGNGNMIPIGPGFGAGAPYLQGFVLGEMPIPEPSALGLAGCVGLILIALGQGTRRNLYHANRA